MTKLTLQLAGNRMDQEQKERLYGVVMSVPPPWAVQDLSEKTVSMYILTFTFLHIYICTYLQLY